jgi:hypothetical protein
MNDAIEVKICFWKFGVNECLTNKRMSALDSLFVSHSLTRFLNLFLNVYKLYFRLSGCRDEALDASKQA